MERMRFKDFTWPKNPAVLKVSFEDHLEEMILPYAGARFQNLGRKKQVVSGEGVFTGPSAQEQFHRLWELQNRPTAAYCSCLICRECMLSSPSSNGSVRRPRMSFGTRSCFGRIFPVDRYRRIRFPAGFIPPAPGNACGILPTNITRAWRICWLKTRRSSGPMLCGKGIG